MVKPVTRTVYEADDGTLFSSQREAAQHEERLAEVKAFLLRYNPDLTEGRGMQSTGYVLVNARAKHDLFVELWCHEVKGPPYQFAQGVFGANAIMPNYTYSVARTLAEITPTQKCPIIGAVETRFARHKLFGEGFHHGPEAMDRIRSQIRGGDA